MKEQQGLKISCVKEKLKQALFLVERVTGRNTTLPILSCVLLKANDKKVSLQATNLDMGIDVTFPAKVENEGVSAIPGSVLYSFVSNLQTEGGVSFDGQNGAVSISSEQNKTSIKTLNHDDFPTIPKLSGEDLFTMPASDIVRGFKSVWYSAAVSSMKPELSSVYIYPDGQTVVFVATDSFRLAEKRVKRKQDKKFPPILVPFKNIPEMIKVLEAKNEDVEVHIGSNQVSFVFSDVYLTSRIIEGSFPDYKQILAKEFKTEAIVLKQDLLSSLKIASVFSDNFNQVNISVDPQKKNCEIKTKNNEIGENYNTLKASVTGEAVDISFNYKYISDCLASIEADSVSLSFNGSGKPLVIRGENNSTFTYLVMPMNK
ncbi:MAG: DNA polymerase III subunit beta [bacterium]|nr:DNA polymerase III subunit beta [bacterium]